MIKRILALLFPEKCVLCRSILEKNETDLCRNCRTETEELVREKFPIHFLAGWTALWYYKGNVRSSLLRFKFGGAAAYGTVYGRLLAMKLYREYPNGFDVLTWVPISPLRRWRRGYDHVAIIAQSVGKELGMAPVPLLKKIRNAPPQSNLRDSSRRKANVLGAFAVTDPSEVAGKRILLLDDIITTGATASECARMLLTAGAKEVSCAAVAAAPHDKKTVR